MSTFPAERSAEDGGLRFPPASPALTGVGAQTERSAETEPEETLDPGTWTELRALGHEMLDDMFTYLEHLRDGPVWRPMPDEVRHRFTQPVPHAPQGARTAYQDFLDLVLPYVTGNAHPRFWGWVCGTGWGLPMLAEMLAAGVDSSVDGFDDAGSHVEAQVIDWCKEMLGFPPDASGLLMSGGSEANLVGLAVARNSHADMHLKESGLAGARRLRVYGSAEMHSSIDKAAQILGLGTEGVCRVPVDSHYRVDCAAMDDAIEDDRRAGVEPMCIVGNAGTVNTGATDDLDALADLAARRGLWLHVDGAFGVWAALSPPLRSVLRGMHRADSLAFDLHKWMYFPYEAGCTLIRRADLHRSAFAYHAHYLGAAERGLAAERTPPFSSYGPQLSRGFRALKIWMGLKEHGADKFRRLIEQNVSQANQLATLVDQADDLELLAPVPLNVVCFRHVGRCRTNDPRLNELNEEIIWRVQERGVAVASRAVLDGRLGLRVAITNHRTQVSDLQVFVAEVQRVGAEVARRLG